MALGPALQALANAHSYIQGRRCACQCFGALVAAIFRKMSRLDMASSSYSIGELTNLVAVDAQIIKDFISYFHLTWATILQVIVSVMLLFWVLGYSAFFGMGFLLISVPLSKLTGKKLKEYQENLMKRKDERMSVMNEVLTGIRIIKMFAWEQDFSEKIHSCRKAEIGQLKWYLYTNAVIIVQWTSTSAIVGLGTFLVHTFLLGKKLSAGQAFAALTLFSQMRWPLVAFPDFLNQAIRANVSVKRLEEFFMKDEIGFMPGSAADGSGAGAAPPLPTGAISIVDGTFHWGQQHRGGGGALCGPGGEAAAEGAPEKEGAGGSTRVWPEGQAAATPPLPPRGVGEGANVVLRGINMEVRPGDLVCIYGPTGCGKSSLLLALLGELGRGGGGGEAPPPPALAGRVAYAGQRPWIQNATIRENILFGREFSHFKYRSTISACALNRDLQILDGGDLTEIGERGINLSGGQQQRISLARAVYADADIYLLDDVLSAVDAHVGDHILKNCIQGALRSKTRVLVTHQVAATVAAADHVVLLGGDGAVVEQGRPEEVRHHQGGRLAALIAAAGGLRPPDDEGQGEEGDARLRARARTSTRTRTLTQEELILVREEERAKGAPALRIYTSYFKACGGVLGFTLPFCFSIIGAQICMFGQSYSLGLWVDRLQTGSNATGGSALWWYLAATGLVLLLGLIRSIVQANGSMRASQTIHDTMAARVLRAPLHWFESTPLGRIVNRFSSDLLEIDEQLMDVLSTFSDCFASSAAVFIVVCYNIPWLLFPLAPVLAAGAAVARPYLRCGRELKRLDSTSKSPVYARFAEAVDGVTTLRAFGETERFYNEITDLVDQNSRANFYTWGVNRWLNVRLELLGALVSGFTAAFVILTTGQIRETIAGLILSYSVQVSGSMTYMVRFQAQLEMEINAVERTSEYSSLEQEAPAVIEQNHPPDGWPSHGEIEFIDLTLKYASSITPALSHLSFRIPPRTKVGIVGRTGAGKSSLTAALFRLVEPAGGKILIDGVDISGLGLRDLRSRLAIVPQDPVLFRGDVRGNLDPFGRATDAELRAALERVRLSGAQALGGAGGGGGGGGLGAPVAAGGANLSVGQRQLLCLARAALRRAAVLVLDEATANVDPGTDALIQGALRDPGFGGRRTVLCVAHRLRTVADYDQVMVLDRGALAEFAPPHRLLQRPRSLFRQLAEASGQLEGLLLLAAAAAAAGPGEGGEGEGGAARVPGAGEGGEGV